MSHRVISVPLWIAVLIPGLLIFTIVALLGILIATCGQSGERYVINHLEAKIWLSGKSQTSTDFLVRTDTRSGQTDIMWIGFNGQTDGWQRVETAPPGVAPHFPASSTTTTQATTDTLPP